MNPLGRQPKAVICLETEELFESIGDAARAVGRVHGVVGRAARTGRAANGFHFYFAAGPKPDPSFFKHPWQKENPSEQSGEITPQRRQKRREQHKRYYEKTAFLYGRREWTAAEDTLVFVHSMPDSELSPLIERSMKAISNRRVRLNKMVREELAPMRELGGIGGIDAMKELPKMTEAQRLAALDRAREIRRMRAELKARLQAGGISIADALDEECAQGMRVSELLRSIPGIGAKRVQAVMGRLHIAQNRRIGGLGPRQREGIIGFYEEHLSLDVKAYNERCCDDAEAES